MHKHANKIVMLHSDCPCWLLSKKKNATNISLAFCSNEREIYSRKKGKLYYRINISV